MKIKVYTVNARRQGEGSLNIDRGSRSCSSECGSCNNKNGMVIGIVIVPMYIAAHIGKHIFVIGVLRVSVCKV